MGNIGGFKTDRTYEFEEGTSELNLKLFLSLKLNLRKDRWKDFIYVANALKLEFER